MMRPAFFLGFAVAAIPTIAPVRAAEPRATFVLDAGWVDVSVTQDGKPIGGALILILDERAQRFAEGMTGPNGTALFPLPAGPTCLVEITTGKRTADTIQLFKTDDRIEPGRVLLSYGLKPCCRSDVVRQEPMTGENPIEPPPAAPFPLLWMAGLALLLGGIDIAAGFAWWPRERS